MSWQVSQDTNPSSNPSVALSFNRRTIAVLLAAIVGLTTVFIIMTGGSGGTIAQAAPINVKAGSLTDHECDATEWHFVITQIDTEANAPTSIDVTFLTAVGTRVTETVDLDKYTGKTAHYVTPSNLDGTVVSATADIYTGWSGQFNLSHGPCNGPSPSPSPSTTPPSPSVSISS